MWGASAVLALELAARVILYSVGNGTFQPASWHLLQRAWAHVRPASARPVDEQGQTWRHAFEKLAQTTNPVLLGDVRRRYAEWFGEFVQEVDREGARLILLRVPRVDLAYSEADLFRRLASLHDIPYVDGADVFAPYRSEDLYLVPADVHLSRFGSRLLATALSDVLHANLGATVRTEAAGPVPARLGPLPPARDYVSYGDRGLPFRVQVNRQGFRNSVPVEQPKRRARVLFLGDSFTFGMHLEQQDTIPSRVAAFLPDVEILNAGVSGYDLTHERALFRDRARFAAPDLVVLQVEDSDVRSMLYLNPALNGADPTPAELAFVEALH